MTAREYSWTQIVVRNRGAPRISDNERFCRANKVKVLVHSYAHTLFIETLCYKMNNLWSKCNGHLEYKLQNLLLLRMSKKDIISPTGTSNQVHLRKVVLDSQSIQFCFILGFLRFPGNVVVIHSDSQSLLIV